MFAVRSLPEAISVPTTTANATRGSNATECTTCEGWGGGGVCLQGTNEQAISCHLVLLRLAKTRSFAVCGPHHIFTYFITTLTLHLNS